MSATTLTHVTARLLKDGVLLESDAATAGPGRPAHALRLAQDSRQVAGVHIGAGGAQIALADLKAETRAFASFDFDLARVEPQTLVGRIADSVRNLAAEIQIDVRRLIGVGVGFPRPADAARPGAFALVDPGARVAELVARFEDALGLPCALEHNVGAMALAESRFGYGRGAASLLYVYLRTGLGAGLVVDGAPFRSGGRGAVELGHIQLAREGRRCACGNVGCLETFLSERVLLEAAGLSEPPQTGLLARVEGNRPRWEEMVGHLTSGLAAAVNLLGPDLIVFGGHLAEAPASLFARLAEDLPPRVMPHMRAHLRIERSRFGWRAGAIGAATVALDEFFYSGALH